MRTFAFIPGQVNKVYNGIVSKYKRYDSIVETFKVGALFFFLLICGFFYLYFVNLSSTRGYFLKQASQNMTTITFKFEILKTKLLDYKQQNWNAISSSSFKRDVVDVSAEIVKIPNGVQLGFLSSDDLIN
ncbi:MAG: hypothetical protein NT085_05645 [candidate division SR1 bacterium]|nr:hypothetical protein [candidate division SR1 bacterium]